MVFEAKCSSDDAIQLAAGTLDSSEFMQKLIYKHHKEKI